MGSERYNKANNSHHLQILEQEHLKPAIEHLAHLKYTGVSETQLKTVKRLRVDINGKRKFVPRDQVFT